MLQGTLCRRAFGLCVPLSSFCSMSSRFVCRVRPVRSPALLPCVLPYLAPSMSMVAPGVPFGPVAGLSVTVHFAAIQQVHMRSGSGPWVAHGVLLFDSACAAAVPACHEPGVCQCIAVNRRCTLCSICRHDGYARCNIRRRDHQHKSVLHALCVHPAVVWWRCHTQEDGLFRPSIAMQPYGGMTQICGPHVAWISHHGAPGSVDLRRPGSPKS